MGNPAPEWVGIEGGQWIDWRSVRWVRGTAGFSTQNAVGRDPAGARAAWECYSRRAANDVVTTEMQEDYYESSPFSLTRVFLPAIDDTWADADDVD